MLNTSGLQLSRKNAGFRTLGAFSAFANSNLSETMASYALNYVPSGPPSTIAVDNAGDGTVAWHLNRGADKLLLRELDVEWQRHFNRMFGDHGWDTFGEEAKADLSVALLPQHTVGNPSNLLLPSMEVLKPGGRLVAFLPALPEHPPSDIGTVVQNIFGQPDEEPPLVEDVTKLWDVESELVQFAMTAPTVEQLTAAIAWYCRGTDEDALVAFDDDDVRKNVGFKFVDGQHSFTAPVYYHVIIGTKSE